MEQVEQDDVMLTTQQAAEMLQLSPVTLRIWRRRNQGPPFVKIEGAAVRYPKSWLSAWLESRAMEFV